MHKKNTSVMKTSKKSLFELLIVPLARIARLNEYKDLNMIHHSHMIMIRQDYYRCSCCC